MISSKNACHHQRFTPQDSSFNTGFLYPTMSLYENEKEHCTQNVIEQRPLYIAYFIRVWLWAFGTSSGKLRAAPNLNQLISHVLPSIVRAGYSNLPAYLIFALLLAAADVPYAQAMLIFLLWLLPIKSATSPPPHHPSVGSVTMITQGGVQDRTWHQLACC